MKKRVYILILSLCLIVSILITGSVNYSSSALYVSSQTQSNKPIIVIDCGHGGEDGGAVSDDNLVLEKDLNLQIGLILEKLFIQGGFEVKMIRKNDTAIYDESAKTLREKKVSDIHNRSKICNSDSNNILISIHQNKFTNSKYYGTQVFYSANTPQSKELAEYIRIAVKSLLQNDNERQCKEATGSVYILDKATVPAILVECGFLSNAKETEKLTDELYRKQLAYSIYAGFLEYYYNSYKN